MRVIAEFVDRRNGKRYFPGEGYLISPALDDDQVEHLTSAGCLKAGEDKAPKSQVTESEPDIDLHKLTRAQLDALAAERGVDITEAKNKDDVIAALELHAEAAGQ